MKKILWLCMLSVIGFSGCIQDLDDWLKTSDVNFKRKADTKYFSKDYASFELSRIKNDLKINFFWQTPVDFPFPIDKNTSDTLTATSFSYCFKEKDKVIALNKTTHCKSAFKKWDIDSVFFIITSPKQNLRNNFSEQLVIPLYYFNALKAGKHEITVDIYQTNFASRTDENNIDSAGQILLEQNAILIKGSITFSLNIPEICRTDIFTNGMELQSDSSFTPAGMDFSLTTPGYPDIYWELFFPVVSETDLSNPCYISSVEQTSTNRFICDTVILYHYSNNDRVVIGVYDQDIITRDDYLGDWYGSLKLFSTKNGTYKKIPFDHVAWFAIKTEPKGVINK